LTIMKIQLPEIKRILMKLFYKNSH